MPLCIQICSLNVISDHRWCFFLAWCNLRLRQNIAWIVLSTPGNHFKTVTFIWFFTYFTFTIYVYNECFITLLFYFTSFTKVLQWYLWRFTLSLYFIPLEPCQNNFWMCVSWSWKFEKWINKDHYTNLKQFAILYYRWIYMYTVCHYSFNMNYFYTHWSKRIFCRKFSLITCNLFN